MECASSAQKLSVGFLLNEQPSSSGSFPFDYPRSPYNDDVGSLVNGDQEIGTPGGTKRETRGRREATQAKKSAPKCVKPNVMKVSESTAFQQQSIRVLRYQSTTTTTSFAQSVGFTPIDPAMLETLPIQKGSIPIVLPRFSSGSPTPPDASAGMGKKRSPSPSSQEYDYLEQVFSINPRPDSKTKQWIAKQLGMDIQHVCGWFQNKRNRMRKMQKKERPKATPLVFHHFLL